MRDPNKLPKGIRLRGSRYFVDVSINGIRRTATCPSYSEAVAKQAIIRAELLTGSQFAVSCIDTPSPPPHVKADPASALQTPSWTLQEALERTSSVVWSGTANGSNAIANAQAALAYFGPTFTLEYLTADRIDEYMGHLASLGYSNATVNRKMAALSKMLTVAIERGKLSKKPVIPRKREAEGRIRFLTESEESRALQLLSRLHKSDHADAFIVLIDTGMRGGELWRLEGRDCDTVQGLISIWETKNGKPRSVPMTDRVKALLNIRKLKYTEGPIFPGSNNFWFVRVWNRMKTMSGLSEDREFVPYALRHTCCSRLVQRGVNLRVVQEWMGHKTITVTLRYAHLCPTNLLHAVDLLNTKLPAYGSPSHTLSQSFLPDGI
jgi:integrase